MNEKDLKHWIDNGSIKPYYGCYIIFPQKIMNTEVLNGILLSLKDNYNFYKIFNTIKAMPKN